MSIKQAKLILNAHKNIINHVILFSSIWSKSPFYYFYFNFVNFFFHSSGIPPSLHMGPFYYHLTLTGQNFSFDVVHPIETDIKLKLLLGCTFCWYQYLRMTKLTRCSPFIRVPNRLSAIVERRRNWIVATVFGSDLGLHVWYVTRSDKRVTKSLGRSRDNWRNHHLGVIWSSYCFWLFHIVGRHFLSYSYCSQPMATCKWP